LAASTPESPVACTAAYLSLQLFEHGFAICLVFFGFDCFTMAYLSVHSKFFPRLIGVLLVNRGLGVSRQQLLALSYARAASARSARLVDRQRLS